MRKTFKMPQRSVYLTLTIVGTLAMFSVPVKARDDMPHWSYGGAENPTQWGRLSKDFAACEVGRDQSPIDIDDAVVGRPAKLDFKYAPAPLVVENNGHTVQVNYAEGSSVTINGQEYELVQFHFHTPSEHSTSGKSSAMELHLVHQNKAGALAVVGIMMEKGTAHSSIDTVWEHIPEAEKTQTVEGITINAADLLPNSRTYYSYAGSLTTPPCDEGVSWNVLAEPIQVSEAQIAKFESLYQVNARPIQPSNGRIIKLHKE